VQTKLKLLTPFRIGKVWLQSRAHVAVAQQIFAVKWYSSLWETHLRATECHLPCVIMQCYLPPDTSECTLL